MCKFWRSMCKFWRSCVKIEEIVEFLWNSWRSRRSISLYSISKIPQNFCEKLFWRSRRSQKWGRDIDPSVILGNSWNFSTRLLALPSGRLFLEHSMFLINKLWVSIHALAFQTCFLYPLTSWACPLTFQTCFPCLSGMLRYACLSGLGISQDLKIDLTTLLSDWSTSLISGYKLGVVRIGISVATDSEEETVAACGLWESAMGKTPSTWLPRNMMGKYWSTSDITSKSQGKIAGIRQKGVWHWI